MDAAEAVREKATTGAGAVLSAGLSISPQGFTFHIDTESNIVSAVLVAGVGLAATYLSGNRIGRKIRDAFERALRGERHDRDVGDINRESLLIDLHCHTAESFLQFIEDYKLGKVKSDLKEELLKIDIEVEEIKIKNEKAVEEHKNKLSFAGIEWRIIEGKVEIINKERGNSSSKITATREREREEALKQSSNDQDEVSDITSVNVMDKVSTPVKEEKDTVLDKFLNKDGTLKDDYETALKSITWIEEYKTEKDDKTRILITCVNDDVPSMGDLKKTFSEEIFPYVEFIKRGGSNVEMKSEEEETKPGIPFQDKDKETQNECEKFNTEPSKECGIVSSAAKKDEKEEELSWFEKNLLDEDLTLKEEHEDALLRLDWIQVFGISGPNEECDALHLSIFCECGEVPCMTELKVKLGKEIVFYVEFLSGMEDDFQYHVTTSDENQKGKAMSGNAIYIDNPELYGTLGYFGSKRGDENATRFATTCYHVCYNGGPLPENDEDKYDRYSEDSEDKESRTRRSVFRYRSRETSAQDGESLGTFLWGKFNVFHDIALVKINDGQDHPSSSDICSWSEIRPFKEINELILKGGCKRVEKIGFTSDKTDGTIFQLGCCLRKDKERVRHRKGYLIENHDPGDYPDDLDYLEYNLEYKPNQHSPFTKPGDSGSIVKLITKDEIEIPFGYCVGTTGIHKNSKREYFYCLSLRESLDEFDKEYTH